jgi:FtsP/CotA-like multicopper oxidase with cupredoxin domain
MPSSRPPQALALACAFAACALLSSTRLAASGDEPRVIRPTVTVETGDTGGMFFGTAPDPLKTRRYYIAAEIVPWDFAPSGRDDMCGFTLPPAVVANRSRTKLRYFQYTDATFTVRALANPALGLLGPVLRGVVGEYLAITFLNRTAQPASLHPHGVRYDKDSEGAYYRPSPGRGAAVGPGAKFTYVWHLDEESGPLPTEPSSKAWLYHSHTDGDAETNLGLIGGLIVTDPSRARPDGTPADVDREFATLFMIFDESGPGPATAAATTSTSPSAPPTTPADAPTAASTPLDWAQTQQRAHEGARYAINGRIYGNLPGLDMNEGDRTRWYLFALGSEEDLHTPHWHGLRVIESGRRTDVVELLPASMKVADLLADNIGTWLYHCHVAEHMREGMFARINVLPRDSVGVSRAPADAFLGLPTAPRSIRIDRAEALLNLIVQPARAEVVILGALAAPDDFAVNGQTVRIRLGDRETAVQLNSNGIGKTTDAWLRINNTDEAGLARGGRLEFELVFSGADWLEGNSPGTTANGTAPATERSRPLAIELASARHSVVVSLANRVISP